VRNPDILFHSWSRGLPDPLGVVHNDVVDLDVVAIVIPGTRRVKVVGGEEVVCVLVVFLLLFINVIVVVVQFGIVANDKNGRTFLVL
jgi:hypothetical protein